MFYCDLSLLSDKNSASIQVWYALGKKAQNKYVKMH